MEYIGKRVRSTYFGVPVEGKVVAQGHDSMRGEWIAVDPTGDGAPPIEITEYDRTSHPLFDRVEIIDETPIHYRLDDEGNAVPIETPSE